FDDRFARRLLAQDLLPRLVAADLPILADLPRTLELQRLEADEIFLVLRHARLLVTIQNLIDLGGREILVEHALDHHHRRAGARRQTLFFLLQEEPSVAGALPYFDAEPLFDVRENFLAAAQHARNVRAHRDVVPTDGLRLEHRIERRDLVHLD